MNIAIVQVLTFSFMKFNENKISIRLMGRQCRQKSFASSVHFYGFTKKKDLKLIEAFKRSCTQLNAMGRSNIKN